IPMHYKTAKLSFYLNTVDKFLMEMKGFKITHDQVLSVNSESLPENTTIKILELTSEDMI
ncbi:MAG: hydrolase, partial [Clostridium perfringens]